MKLKIYLIFPFFILLVLFNKKISYGNIEKVEVSKISNYIYSPTMYVEEDLIWKDIKIKDDGASIKNISKGANLYIYLKEDAKKDFKIDINLENAQWFFRSTKNYSNNSQSSIATEGYTDEEVIENFETNYNIRKGIFIPSSKTSKTGIYYRESFNKEQEYILQIKTPKEATLILKNDIYKNDYIVIPLVIKTQGYKDATVNVKTEKFNTTLTFTTYNYDNKDNSKKTDLRTKTYVNNYSKGREEFTLDSINIREIYLNTIEKGMFELICQDGYIFVPNLDNIDITSITNENTLNAKDSNGYVVNVSLEGGLEWKNGKYKTGEGEREKDYSIEYSIFGPSVNKSKLIIDIKDINKSKNIEGALIIKGLKLLNLHNFNNYDNNENIYLYIRSINNKRSIENERFKVGELIPNKNIYLNNAEIMEDSIVNTKNNGHDYPFLYIPNFINIENYDINTLITMEDFQKKSYLKDIKNNMIKPDEYITRKELTDMIYYLLGNDRMKYKMPFLDCDENNSKSIGFCFSKGYIKGYEDNTFKPESKITRGEFAKILNNILNIKSNFYTDILPKEHFAYKDVCSLVYKGIISGYPDGKFKENNYITKAEAIVMINKSFNRSNSFSYEEEFLDLKKDHWAYNYIMNAIKGYQKSED